MAVKPSRRERRRLKKQKRESFADFTRRIIEVNKSVEDALDGPYPILRLAVGAGFLNVFTSILRDISFGVFTKDADGNTTPAPMPSWLIRPLPNNANYDAQMLIAQLGASLILDGNFFILRNTGEETGVNELAVLDPKSVTTAGTLQNPSYQITNSGQSLPGPNNLAGFGSTFSIDTAVVGESFNSEQVIHRFINPIPGQARGQSPFQLARDAVANAIYAQEASKTFFQSGINPAIIATRRDEEWGEQELEAIREAIDTKHKGVQKQHDILFLSGVDDLKPVQANPAAAQMIEFQEYANENLSRAIRIPLWLLSNSNPSSITYDSAGAFLAHFTRSNIQPILKIISGALNTLLDEGQEIIFDLRDLLAGDENHQLDVLGKALRTGAMTVNEARASMNLDPVDDEFANMLLASRDLMSLENIAVKDGNDKVRRIVELLRAGLTLAEALSLIGMTAEEFSNELQNNP